MRVTAVQTGIVMGVLAVAAGILSEVRPPEAYGVCMACHARDLVNWIFNWIAHTSLTVAPASLVVPVLTPVGVLVGAVLAARTSREFRWVNPENSVKTFLYGLLVMNFALIAGGCSIRLLLRTSNAEILGATGFAGLVAGVVLGTVSLRWWATR